MNILLIGNGFDLEHKLPTSYRDFLEFSKRLLIIYTYNYEADFSTYKMDNLDNWEMNNDLKDILANAFKERSYTEPLRNKITTPNNALNDMYALLYNNIWFEYFLKQYINIGENWIDFESEISRVIQHLNHVRNKLKSNIALTTGEQFYLQDLNEIWYRIINYRNDPYKRLNFMDEFIEALISDLDKLIRALEIYISEFVNSISVFDKNTDICNLNPDCVLSFNYSNTYERIYDKERKIEYCYIHGRANMTNNIETCNMVLGIDEYLDDNRKNFDLEFLTFKKYYQRIYKETDNSYLLWADKIKSDYNDYIREKTLAYAGNTDTFQTTPWQKTRFTFPTQAYCPIHTLYIFGHSLDITDKDVLVRLISNDNVQTKIFYHRKNENDKRALGKIIKNLVKILGQEELIRRTGGSTQTIEFIPQDLNNH